LSLIKSNLDKGVYTTASKVDEDVMLMLENARMFNGEGPVVDAANDFERWWKLQRSRMD
jgi:transcription initiation factor TFIID subunit 2